MTNNDDIDEAEKLLEKATREIPWGCTQQERDLRHAIDDSVHDLGCHMIGVLPGWLAELRALRKLRDAVDSIAKWSGHAPGCKFASIHHDHRRHEDCDCGWHELRRSLREAKQHGAEIAG